MATIAHARVPNPALRSRLCIGILALLTATAGLVLPAAPSLAAVPPAVLPATGEMTANGEMTAAGSISARAVLPAGFKSVGYQPSWAGNVNTIQYNMLTHINYAFVLPNANGTLGAVENPAKLQSLVTMAHANNVKVLVSLGGWMGGNDAPFETMAATPATRTTFATSIINLIGQYNLDGIDIDWEYPNAGVSGDNFTLVMRQLSTALHSRGKLLTAAVISAGGTALGVQPAVFGYVDFLNIMLYDGGTPHANYDWTITYVNQWKARGLPAAKAIVGVPFYSRPTGYAFAQLIAMDPANADRDCTTVGGAQQCYNGRPTIARKTKWALANAGGIMMWELSQDGSPGSSLLGTVFATAVGSKSGQISGIGSKCIDVAGSRTADGTPVQLWGCNGTNAQRWTVFNDGTMSAMGKCLDVSGSGTANGTKVQLWGCNGSGAQVWKLLSPNMLRNPNSNKCLDSPSSSTADGTQLQIWECNGTNAQTWHLPTG